MWGGIRFSKTLSGVCGGGAGGEGGGASENGHSHVPKERTFEKVNQDNNNACKISQHATR